MAGVPSNWQFYQIKFEFSIVLPTNFSVDIFNFQIYCGEIDFTIIFICIEMNIPTKIEKIIEDYTMTEETNGLLNTNFTNWSRAKGCDSLKWSWFLFTLSLHPLSPKKVILLGTTIIFFNQLNCRNFGRYNNKDFDFILLILFQRLKFWSN